MIEGRHHSDIVSKISKQSDNNKTFFWLNFGKKSHSVARKEPKLWPIKLDSALLT